MIVLTKIKAEVNIKEYKLSINKACKNIAGILRLNPNTNTETNRTKFLLKLVVRNISNLAINMACSSSNEFVLKYESIDYINQCNPCNRDSSIN